MAQCLDILLASPAKSPPPVKITATTTLEDIIAATIQPETTTTEPDCHTHSPTNPEDDETIAAEILAEVSFQKSPTPTQRSYSFTSPATENRLADSLTDLLGPLPSEQSLYSQLTSLLKAELKQQTRPDTLLNLLTKPKTSLFTREQLLHHQFTKLEPLYPIQITELSTFYKYQSAMIETERYQSLHHHATRPDLRDSINSKYDDLLHQAIDRVELNVNKLQQTISDQPTHKTIYSRPGNLRSRPVLSQTAVQLMENWYHSNIAHPYPDQDTIESIAQHGNIKDSQVRKWFANKRSRSHNTHSRSAVIQRKVIQTLNRNSHYQPY